MTIGLSGVVNAATPPSTGLGQAWPNATDVSTSPNYHAYVFVLGGIQYIQINDLNGNVLGSVGTTGGQFITLPIGKFAQLVSTPQQPAATTSNAAPTTSPTTVYNDGTTTVTATPMSDGTTQLSAQLAATCNGADPAGCGTHGS
ncbi:hypothetical protein ISP13_09325 [Dyella lipolytica]|uniref:Uncharacterized protein n=1 Tax=Dyella lipolytica TaxID=1867835 RepID=A0ABW8IUU4_9GAMM